ncbi:Antibiotic biosynthesis monooxygenase [Pseudomonas syringae]|uniref:antibiotic biosynthesis monooxygenase n=1 Tax=Pseudomonas syringae TaxID=317 RepID=UPI0008962DC8|nr:antibiotic biosynthesis monooxygenase [Pseudomonas syringae]SDX56409.1 Antibiotic biosynthesis monooxygenase [Pseudomonas syringae]SFM67284.1 Antibiotic biosynthesis monooxygenase [Pseudomonas syringae]
MKMELFDARSVTDDKAIYLINVVQVNEGAQDLAIEILEEAVSYVARTYSAFQWSRLMKSTDGKTVINQAQWSDQKQFESLFQDEEFLSRYRRLEEAGTWEYHLYGVAEYITPETALQKVG